MNKEVQQLIRKLRRIPGVTVGNGTHPKVSYQGQMVTTLPRTPSDHRSLANAVAKIKRAGVPLDYVEPKRAANGQAPPPLPQIERKDASMATLTISDKSPVLQDADSVVKAIETHWQMAPPRKNRYTGYGVKPRLTEVLLAYAKATGKPVPHREYTTRDTSNEQQMASLAAGLIVDYAAVNRGALGGSETMSPISKAIVAYAHDAWEWFEGNDYQLEVKTVAEAEAELDLSDERLEAFDNSGPWLPPRPDDMPKVEVASTNGQADEIDTIMQAVALMGKGGDTYEAARIGKRLYEALRP